MRLVADGMALALYDIVSAANEWGHSLCVCVQKFVPRRSKRTHSHAAKSARRAQLLFPL